ncbi:MAG: hypothetical protein AB8G16_00550 [Gammaproteobacteria bacterium]
MPEHDFYVGYKAQAPAGTRRFLGIRIVGATLIALLVITLINLTQSPYADANFEFGVSRSFEGVVSEYPYPTLLIPRPGRSETMPYSRYLLSAPGKFGTTELFNGLQGTTVRLSGSLIYRDEQTMIEIQPDTIESLPGDSAIAADETLGAITLRGEIVDSKCYLGVMKPATFKPHKACAIRCLSGGIPAILVVRRDDGRREHVLLADAQGRALNEHILDRVAQPVSVSGELFRRGSDLILRADPADVVAL